MTIIANGDDFSFSLLSDDPAFMPAGPLWRGVQAGPLSEFSSSGTIFPESAGLAGHGMGGLFETSALGLMGGAGGTLFSPANPPSMAQEVAFISGVNADGTLPLDAFSAWNGDTPATYTGGFTNTAKWGSNVAGTTGGTVLYYFDPASNWTPTEQSALASGLALWSDVANITFAQTTNASAAQIEFTRGSDGSAETTPELTGDANAGVTGSSDLLTMQKATVSIDTSVRGFGPINGNFTTFDGYPTMTYLHEEGHSIGLGHAGPYNGDDDPSTQQFSPFDTRLWSIMSYIEPQDTSAEYLGDYTLTGTNWHGNEPTGLMPLDILAAEALYGAQTNGPLSGGQTFGFNCNVAGPSEIYFDFTKNTNPILALWDEGSNNTLDLSGFSQAETVNLNPGTFSSVDGMTNNLAIAFGTAIDTLVGGSGNDTITANSDVDHIDGGAGTNTVSYAYATSGVAVSLALTGAQNTVGAGTDTLENFQNLQGSAFDDTLYGNAGANVLDGWVGTNTVSYAYATSGVAVSLALTGAQNTIGAGTDTLLNFQNLQGSAFDDTLYGNAGANVLDGWVGTNTVSYAYATSGVAVSLALTGAQNTVGAGTDTLENFQNLQGSAFDDTLYGNAGANVLDGWVGTNTVSYAYATSGVAVSLALTGAQNTVGAGTDTLENFQNLQGSAFDDTLYGNSGNNVLDGWVGTNTVSYAYATSGVTVSLALTGAQNTVGAGTDTLENFQNLQGSAFDDTLAGNAGDNVLDGWVGTNTVSYEHAAAGVTVSLAVSGAQNTIGDGTDTLENFQNLIGSAFNDILTGNTANNVLTGNGGADTFQFNTSFGQDTITDFIPGDIIHFGAGTFADFATVSSHAVQQGSDVLITLDANDTLLLKNVQLANLHAGDFVFG